MSIGALGLIPFQPGYYIYTGRAKRNLRQRIERHLRKEKKIRWHIDYFLVKGRVEDVLIYSGRLDECRINREVYKIIDGAEPVKGFGSSDCRCRSHLIYTGCKPNYDPNDIPG